MYTGGIESAPIVRDVRVRVLEGPSETRKLHAPQLILTRALDGLELMRIGRSLRHAISSSDK
jgi:hypothetical protein